MKKRHLMMAGLFSMALLLVSANRYGYSEPRHDPLVRLAELEIDPVQVNAYKTALKEEIENSIRKEPGVLALDAVSIKGHSEQVRLFETYRDEASYKAHLQSPHFKKYKEATKLMVKSLTLLEADSILLGSKCKQVPDRWSRDRE